MSIQQPNIRFSRKLDADFNKTLRQRVNAYFADEKLGKKGNYKMYLKTAIMLSLYLVPFALMLTGVITNKWIMLGMAPLMGIGVAGIGLSVMHDANHGAYSNKNWVNRIIGYTLNLLGGNAFNWKMQHNTLHHTYTNIDGMDEDLETIPLLRFSPHAKRINLHRFQYIYAWFFYGLMTLSWALFKDFRQIYTYHKKGLFKLYNTSLKKELPFLIASKVFYYGFILALPMIFMEITFLQWLTGFLVMHFVAGIILAMIFQPAHIVADNIFPKPDETGNMEDNFLAHQMKTTINFGNNNKLLNWYAGGLNFQIEHHLFPNVCHIHYKQLAPIVKETAREFNLPYHEIPTFRGAIAAHSNMLKKLGNEIA
ncbi:MAG: acyl-CoA desaturase [Chitinophagales bacterium]